MKSRRRTYHTLETLAEDDARFRQWGRAGFFEALWRKGLAEYDEFGGIGWKWRPADGTNLEARVTRPADGAEQNICLDAGHVGKERDVWDCGCIPHIRPQGEEASEIKRNPGFKARRWVVERFHSWVNRFRKLVPRHEKTDLSYCGLLNLAAAMITLNKVIVIYG